MDARQDQIAKGTESLPEKTVEFTVSNWPAPLFDRCCDISRDVVHRAQRKVSFECCRPYKPTRRLSLGRRGPLDAEYVGKRCGLHPRCVRDNPLPTFGRLRGPRIACRKGRTD